MSRPKALVFFAFLVSLVAAALVLWGVWRRPSPGRPPWQELALERPGLKGPVRAGQARPVTIEATTRVRFRTLYELCGTEEVQEVSPDAFLLGLELESLRRLYPGWKVVRFTREWVELEKRVSELCPEMRDYRHLGIVDGYVAVLYGKPRPGAPVETMTNIQDVWLTEADRRRIREGIVVSAGDREAIWRILEGLTD